MTGGIDVIDLEAHKAICAKCRQYALCAKGREIVRLAGEAWLVATEAYGSKRTRARA